MSKSQLNTQILDLFDKNNRPYATNDIVNLCGKDVRKYAVQQALNELVNIKAIRSKMFGKNVIYYPNPTKDYKTIELELKEQTHILAETNKQIKQKEQVLRELELELRNLKSERSIESLDDERDDLFNEIRALKEKIKNQETMAAKSKLTAADAQLIEERYRKAVSAYRKYKRICMDMINAILEGYPVTKAELMEEIGVETDEAAGFALNIRL